MAFPSPRAPCRLPRRHAARRMSRAPSLSSSRCRQRLAQPAADCSKLPVTQARNRGPETHSVYPHYKNGGRTIQCYLLEGVCLQRRGRRLLLCREDVTGPKGGGRRAKRKTGGDLQRSLTRYFATGVAAPQYLLYVFWPPSVEYVCSHTISLQY